ncbi:uncharacterized protein [Elaeis guineensis]|uniref:Uncharacterized protein LOC105052469 n=1 Tax=Elaeis guineensis var. tenera TaxID=51953 RepID=A0A6I9RTC5_ELAGV|nr:uncharacterized protein LOC105052469 [Elaeis guineensis]
MAALRLRCMVLAFAMAGVMLCGFHAQAQTLCGQNLANLIFQCLQFVQIPGPTVNPSKKCCAEVKKVDVVCICKNIPPLIEKLVSVPKAVHVAKFCGRPLPKGTKCGNYTVPLA